MSQTRAPSEQQAKHVLHVSNEPNTCPTCAASQTRAGKKAYKKVVDNRNTFNLRPCHTRQFVLPTCNTISAKKILQFQTLFTCLRPAMRLYCRTAEYLKMSAAFRLCRIVIGSFSKNCETSCSGGVTRCNLSRSIAKSRSCFYFLCNLEHNFIIFIRSPYPFTEARNGM